jgi:hypothetical protein
VIPYPVEHVPEHGALIVSSLVIKDTLQIRPSEDGSRVSGVAICTLQLRSAKKCFNYSFGWTLLILSFDRVCPIPKLCVRSQVLAENRSCGKQEHFEIMRESGSVESPENSEIALALAESKYID